MTYIKFIKLVLLNAISAVIHTDTHFGATKNVLLESNISPGYVRYKNWTEQYFFYFLSLSRFLLFNPSLEVGLKI